MTKLAAVLAASAAVTAPALAAAPADAKPPSGGMTCVAIDLGGGDYVVLCAAKGVLG